VSAQNPQNRRIRDSVHGVVVCIRIPDGDGRIYRTYISLAQRKTMENGNGRAIRQQSIHYMETPRGSQVNLLGHLYWAERLIAQPVMVNIGAV